MTRRPPLGLTALEDRATPATATYAAGTLTVTAVSGDILLVGLNGQGVPGFLQVVAGPVIFDSGRTTTP